MSFLPPLFFFSPPREKGTKKRARCTLRVRQNHDSEHFCCGTRYAQTGPRNAFGTMLDHRILYLPLSLSQHFEPLDRGGSKAG